MENSNNTDAASINNNWHGLSQARRTDPDLGEWPTQSAPNLMPPEVTFLVRDTMLDKTKQEISTITGAHELCKTLLPGASVTDLGMYCAQVLTDTKYALQPEAVLENILRLPKKWGHGWLIFNPATRPWTLPANDGTGKTAGIRLPYRIIPGPGKVATISAIPPEVRQAYDTRECRGMPALPEALEKATPPKYVGTRQQPTGAQQYVEPKHHLIAPNGQLMEFNLPNTTGGVFDIPEDHTEAIGMTKTMATQGVFGSVYPVPLTFTPLYRS